MSDGNEKIYDFVRRSADAGLVCSDPSLAVQSARDDADINTIVRRFGLTGTLPQSLRLPEYGDYDAVYDYHSAQLAIVQADREFMTIPAEIRAKFDNDPGSFFLYAADPANIDGLREMGLAKENQAEILPAVSAPPPNA